MIDHYADIMGPFVEALDNPGIEQMFSPDEQRGYHGRWTSGGGALRTAVHASRSAHARTALAYHRNAAHFHHRLGVHYHNEAEYHIDVARHIDKKTDPRNRMRHIMLSYKNEEKRDAQVAERERHIEEAQKHLGRLQELDKSSMAQEVENRSMGMTPNDWAQHFNEHPDHAAAAERVVRGPDAGRMPTAMRVGLQKYRQQLGNKLPGLRGHILTGANS